MKRYNLCSGQRPFGKPFVNVDVQAKWKPDLLADCRDLSMIESESTDMVVIHHGLEHFGLGEADSMLKECYRILVKGGSLIVCVPDLRELAKAWLRGSISDYIYCVNLYGAYMNDEADRHKWGMWEPTLRQTLEDAGYWKDLKRFDFRKIEGASIAKDWWVLAMEAVK
jgi:predicted SAM-dependent methyltransferase